MSQFAKPRKQSNRSRDSDSDDRGGYTDVPGGSTSSKQPDLDLALSRGTIVEREGSGTTTPGFEQRLEESMPRTVGVPENIYGVAMAAMARMSEHNVWETYASSSGAFLLLFLNIAIQFYVLYAVKLYICAPSVAKTQELYRSFHHTVRDSGSFNVEAWEGWDPALKHDLCQLPLSQPLFFLTMLSIWTATVMIDLRETMAYFAVWYHMPSPEDNKSVEFEWEDGEIITVKAGRCLKAGVLVIILLPKMMIALLLWWIGARWLTSTRSWQDAILNAVALSFIVELDEVISVALLPYDYLVETSMFTLQRPERGDHKKLQQKSLLAMIIKVGFVVAIPYLYLTRFQMVLPNYKWDVRHPCQLLDEEILSTQGG